MYILLFEHLGLSEDEILRFMDVEIDEDVVHDGADLHNKLLLSQRLNLGRNTPERHIVNQAYAIYQIPAALNAFSEEMRERITSLASDTIERARIIEEAKKVAEARKQAKEEAARQQQLFFDDLLTQGSLTVLINGCPVQIGIDTLAQAIARRIGVEQLRQEVQSIDNRTSHLIVLG